MLKAAVSDSDAHESKFVIKNEDLTNLLVTFWRISDEIFGKFRTKILKNLQNFENLGREKNVEIVDLGKELSNVYLVVKIGFDTEENGPFEVWDRKMGVQVTNRIRRNIGDDHDRQRRIRILQLCK